MDYISFANKVPMSKVNWSNDRVLKLIELYHRNECLWNGKSIEYKNRIKKSDAWDRIANEMETMRTLIESKMHNIRSQFMRERKKMLDSMKSSAGDNVYVTNWFAYEHLTFLLENVEAGISLTEGHDTDAEESQMKNESSEEAFIEEEAGSSSNSHVDFTNHLKKKKSKRHTDDKLTLSGSKLSPILASYRRDDYSIYGEYIASEIRKLKNERVAAIVKNNINNIIFEAQMGNYDYSYYDNDENTQPPYLSNKREERNILISTPYKQQSQKKEGI